MIKCFADGLTDENIAFRGDPIILLYTIDF